MNTEGVLSSQVSTVEESSELARHSLATVARQKRPGGITFLSIINMIGGALYLIAAIAISGDPTAPGAIGATVAVLGILSLVIAFGLWALRNWARVTAVVMYSLSALFGLFSLLAGAPAGLVQLIVAGLILSCLCGSHSVRAFQDATEYRRSISTCEPGIQS